MNGYQRRMMSTPSGHASGPAADMAGREAQQQRAVDDELHDLLGAAALAALKAWLEAEGLSIVRLPNP